MSKRVHNSKVEWFDPAQVAADSLNSTIREESSKNVKVEEIPEPVDESVVDTRISVDEARAEKPIHRSRTERNQLRVLFFTKDQSILQSESPAYKRITDLRHTFAEIHIVLLTHKSAPEPASVSRLFDRVWLYRTESTSWWKQSYDAYKCAEEQLVFSNGFRADVIIAEDIFECGLAGWFLAKRFARPMQVHIYEDFFDDAYIDSHDHPTLYTWVSQYLVRRIPSICTKTEFQRSEVLALRKENDVSVEVLPSYYDLSGWRDFKESFDLHDRYPQFKFVMLHISSMHNRTHTEDVLLGVSPLLRKYPTVGLVVVGNGPLRTHLEGQAIALGLKHKIIFEPMPTEVLSHIKTANVLIHLSEDGAEDDILLGAASVETPIVGIQAGVAGKLFVNGESARLCPVGDIACVTESINGYLNDNHTRTQYALRAYDTVMERIEQDYSGYIEAYADTIERSLHDSARD